MKSKANRKLKRLTRNLTRKVKHKNNVIYDFSKIHPASIMIARKYKI